MMMMKKLNESFEKAAVTEMRIFSLSLSVVEGSQGKDGLHVYVSFDWAGNFVSLSLSSFCAFSNGMAEEKDFCLFVFLPSWRES